MFKIIKNTYLTNRFFWIFGGLVLLFCLSFPFSFLFPIAQTLLILGIILTFLDISLLFNKKVSIDCRRKLPKLLSLGDPNKITLNINNPSNLTLKTTIIEELPVQFQKRDFAIEKSLQGGEAETIQYELTPTVRGEYEFGYTNIFLETFLGLVQRKVKGSEQATVSVYPSIIQMREMQLKALSSLSYQEGIKKVRRLGHSYEFEQIKNYVRGDDYRSINWKAISRKGVLMVNQYEDERAQQVYSIIDKSRNMKMPFNGMSLMDYAVNTSLAISNIILRKHDRAGLITFSDKIGTVIKAERKPTQLNKILNALYKEKSGQLESDYELLYYAARKLVNRRSLFLLYTNFESRFSLERVLPILRRINKFHLLVVIIFENTEIKSFVEKEVSDTEGIYFQTVARKYLNEKEQMVQMLKQFGIQSILTKPEDLSINTVNKYLMLKSRGLI
ncbi:MAG: DUF58 domain-containing protein [Bacteroidota bacterium]